MEIIEERPEFESKMLRLDIAKIEQSHESKDTLKHKSRRARIQRSAKFKRRWCRGRQL